MDRDQQFQQQLKYSSIYVVKQLLNNEDKKWLRDFYDRHFEEIKNVLKVIKPRLAIENLCNIEPALSISLIEDSLFVYQVNLAIVDGTLKREMF